MAKPFERETRFQQYLVHAPGERTRTFEDMRLMLAFAFERAMLGDQVTIETGDGKRYEWAQLDRLCPHCKEYDLL